ncbi:hypothetical protein CR513_58161, partial [Mucuna pruriens]
MLKHIDQSYGNLGNNRPKDNFWHRIEHQSHHSQLHFRQCVDLLLHDTRSADLGQTSSSSLKVGSKGEGLAIERTSDKAQVHLLDLDLRQHQEDMRLKLMEDLKEFQIGPNLREKPRIGGTLKKGVEKQLIYFLSKN